MTSVEALNQHVMSPVKLVISAVRQNFNSTWFCKLFLDQYFSYMYDERIGNKTDNKFTIIWKFHFYRDDDTNYRQRTTNAQHKFQPRYQPLSLTFGCFYES